MGVNLVLEVYNHLISAYQPKYKNYTAVNGKDSKNVYQKIRDISMQSPVFKFNLTNEKQVFALNIKDSALALKYHLDDLSDADSPVFSSHETISSDTEIASVSVLTNKSNIEYVPESISLRVDQLAKPQMNQSYEVPSYDKSILSGSYSFSIEVDEYLSDYQFKILQGSNHEAIFTKFADFINKSQIGLIAAVNNNKLQNTSNLTLTSVDTGFPLEPIFTIKDTDKLPRLTETGIVDYYGLGTIKQSSANAVVEINGEKKEILNNKFTLNKALTISLHNTSEEPIQIETVPNADMITNEINQTLNNYNSLIDLASSNTGNRRSAKLLNELTHVVKEHFIELNDYGFTVEENYHLTADKEKLRDVIKNGELKQFFSKDSIFYKNLSQAAFSITLNPMEYLDKVIVTYPNTAAPGSYSPYTTSIYSGMLFNYYC